jgi:hypothetical protein
MKILRDSIGFIFAAMLIVGLLGLAGWAGWSVYAAHRAVEELTVHPQAGQPEPVIAEPPVAPPPASEDGSWKLTAEQLEQRLRRLEQSQNMPQNVARGSASSVALVIGEYVWTDRSGRHPLRYAGLDNSGAPLRDQQGQEIVSFDGEGPVIIREFSGTAFLLASGEVLTTSFVLSPWADDPLLDASDDPERIPSMRMLHAYFPGSTSAVDLKIEHPDEDAQTVICSIKGTRPAATGLKFGKAGVDTGEALVSIGYPGGVALMAARVPDDMRRELLKFPGTATDEVAQFLAERGFIQPVVLQARVTAQSDRKIFYNMANSFGNTGGPLLNAEGKVVAVSEAINSNFPGLNLALPVK